MRKKTFRHWRQEREELRLNGLVLIHYTPCAPFRLDRSEKLERYKGKDREVPGGGIIQAATEPPKEPLLPTSSVA